MIKLELLTLFEIILPALEIETYLAYQTYCKWQNNVSNNLYNHIYQGSNLLCRYYVETCSNKNKYIYQRQIACCIGLQMCGLYYLSSLNLLFWPLSENNSSTKKWVAKSILCLKIILHTVVDSTQLFKIKIWTESIVRIVDRWLSCKDYI